MVSVSHLRRTSTVVVLSAALLASAALAAPPSPGRLASEVTSSRSAPPLVAGPGGLAAMVDLETKMTDSLQFGHAVPVVFDSEEQLPGRVVAAPYWGDTGLWSGVYLGGQALRYATATHYLAGRKDKDRGESAQAPGQNKPALTGEERAFWTAQRDEALSRVQLLQSAAHRDININEDWNGTLRIPPDVNTQNPTGPHTADFGGGVIKGERGMITRGCTPVRLGPLGINPPNRDATNPINDHSNHVYEITWKSGDGGTYNCETSPSRDTYAGMVFGLLTAYDLVGPDEPAMRAQIRADLLAMTAFLLKYGWNFPRPNGYVGTRNDEDGFISLMMAQVPMARLNMANAARHVAESPAEKQKWDAVWAEELASQGPILGASLEFDSLQPSNGYFKFNLHHLNGFNLLRTTSGPERDLVARSVAIMDKTTGDDINAHFEALLFAVTGDKARRDAASTHLKQWLEYRAAISGGRAVSNSTRCGDDLTCVPNDQYGVVVDQAPGGSVTYYPGAPELQPLSSASQDRASAPLPVAQRPPADFLWQRPSTDLDGQQGATSREPGIDFLTPYWVLRYFTEVAPSTAGPLPAYAGPGHV